MHMEQYFGNFLNSVSCTSPVDTQQLQYVPETIIFNDEISLAIKSLKKVNDASNDEN